MNGMGSEWIQQVVTNNTFSKEERKKKKKNGIIWILHIPFEMIRFKCKLKYSTGTEWSETGMEEIKYWR